MTPLDALDTRYPAPNAAAARFFLRIGQAGRAAEPKDDRTLPLFGLPLILEAEGLLARELAYLKRCEEAIRRAAEAMA